MIIITTVYILLVIFSVRIKCSPFNNQLYLDGYKLENTNSVKGLLAIGILLSHLPKVCYNELPFTSVSAIGVIGVGAFFFFSGYALAYVSKKRSSAFDGFISKKLFRIGVPFAFLFSVSLIYNIINNHTADFFISFVKGYPYSNTWYVFAIILFYLFFYFCFKKCDFNNKKSILIRIFLLIICITIYTIFTAFVFKWGDWWYKTPICFVIGVAVGFFKNVLKKIIKKFYFLIIGGCILFVIFSYFLPAINNRVPVVLGNNIWVINDILMGISFTLLLIVILYKISFVNPITSFLGNYSYEIYLWHGLIIKILSSSFEQYLDNFILQELFALSVLIISLILSVAFNKLLNFLKN